MIEVEDLVKDYGSTRAVAGVSFRVQPGEVVGLLGPNGAGKSTTLRVLTGVLEPTSGGVRLAGLDVRENPLEAKRRTGYLSENNPLYESLGVWECLELFARLRGLGAGRRRLMEAAEQCALTDVISKDVSQLSKGYRQRLGLALAILHDPEVLVLDEPTSALDPNQQREVHDLIRRLKEKKTVLLSTHILSGAQDLCDRFLIIHQGAIRAQGTLAELQGEAAGERSAYVRLRASRGDIASALAALPGVSRAEFADEEEPGCPGFHVVSAEDPRPALARLAAEKRWPLLELRRRVRTLHEVFQSVTGAAL